jgi:hypothetical protein
MVQHSFLKGRTLRTLEIILQKWCYTTLTKTREGAYSFEGEAMIRTIAAAVFALLTVTAPAHAATIQWDFFGVGDNSVVTGLGPTFAKISVAGYFDYDTTTGAVSSLLPDPFDYQVYSNGNLALDCFNGQGCQLSVSNNTQLGRWSRRSQSFPTYRSTPT